jgi:hypothetical protein
MLYIYIYNVWVVYDIALPTSKRLHFQCRVATAPHDQSRRLRKPREAQDFAVWNGVACLAWRRSTVPILSVGYMRQISTNCFFQSMRRNQMLVALLRIGPLEMSYESIQIPTFTKLKMIYHISLLWPFISYKWL